MAGASELEEAVEAQEAGPELTEYSLLRLWATAECRERWRGALQPQSQSQSPPPSFATVALCARALRAHADALAHVGN